MDNYYLESVDSVISDLKTRSSGLTQDEVDARLAQHGRNELNKAKKKSLLRRFAAQLINPMVLILLAAAAVSVIVAAIAGHGANEYTEAAIILAVVIINSILGVVQEGKAEKAIEALQEMSAATAKVRRNGTVMQIHASDLTVGDIVLIEAGDCIPADMRIIQCASLKIEEAALTGESVPAEKKVEPLSSESGKVSLGDRKNMAYMGSIAVYGRGEGVVTAVGMNTEMGKIAGIIQSTAEGETPLQKRLSKLSKVLSIAVLGICVVIFGVSILNSHDFSTEGILSSFMIAISLAVAAIPEGLAAVVTIVLSIGVTRMAKRNAIIRKLPAVETLGCTQVICSDKTGTLTQNKMTVTKSYGDTQLLATAMALCCDSSLDENGSIIGDPTENALIAFALKEGLNKNELDRQFPRVAEAPFDSIRKMMSTIHQTPNGITQYTKGAPDEVLRVCSHALIEGKRVAMTSQIMDTIVKQNADYADQALRVLACAYKDYDAIPAGGPEQLEKELTFIGLEAMIDPVRPEVKAAVASCKSAGIRVVMITGDHKDTAAAIARELGIIESSEQAITGLELDTIPDEEFEKRIESCFVYARVQPEHKVRIVNMWKKKGYVTAMTGDGVNDAPAIKSGDIGVAMGITGTDVTKNVADIVLADDNFATIVSAVEEGRRIYDNISKTIQFLLASNLSEVLSIFIVTIIGFIVGHEMILFLPVHLLFINLVTDSIPAVALGMETPQPKIMQRPPRSQKGGVFSDGMGFNIIYQGVLVAGLTLAAFFIVRMWEGADSNLPMAAAFITMAMCEIFHAYNMRSQKQSIFTLKKQNWVLWGAMFASLALTLMIIYVPFLGTIFKLEPLTITELAVALALSVTIIPMVEAVKAILRYVEKKRRG